MRVRPLPVRSWRNFGEVARETGHSRVPAPPAGTTAQNPSMVSCCAAPPGVSTLMPGPYLAITPGGRR
jgi:hypothetical protein